MEFDRLKEWLPGWGTSMRESSSSNAAEGAKVAFRPVFLVVLWSEDVADGSENCTPPPPAADFAGRDVDVDSWGG